MVSMVDISMNFVCIVYVTQILLVGGGDPD